MPLPPSPAPRTRYALIGAGARAETYLTAITGPHADVAELAAVFDTNPVRIAFHLDRLALEATGGTRPPAYDPAELEAKIAELGIQRVIVTTPDYTHAEFISRIMDAGADVVVEKPLTIDPEGCRTILRAIERTGRDLVLTFNYRYSPRNAALKQLIASGAIGEVTSVHFEWLLDTRHGADYFRRWHREKANSGGLLVHKSSHHFDLVNWWLDDVPTRVFASGGLRFYGAENAARRGLPPRPEPRDGDPTQDPFLLDLGGDERLRGLYLEAEAHDGYIRDRDVFGEGITIEDNLSLVVDYARGTSMSYSLNAHSPWEGYTVGVNGTLGRAELQVVERGAVIRRADGTISVDPSVEAHTASGDDARPEGERLLLQRHWEHSVGVPIDGGDGGHGGGDALLFSAVFEGGDDDPLGRAAGYGAGLAAVAVGAAGNRSLATGQAVLINDLDLGARLGAPERNPR
ncbi:MAG TPA: Gfo/Idh/MocA family oxidoreductase [Actinospica sp.]|nr:Gfo/Idh/MocA family oxidoreductase [Actinospica sp.]